MAPTAKSTTGRTPASSATEPTQGDLQEELLVAQAEIEMLRAQLRLAGQTPQDPSQGSPELVTVLEALAQRLDGSSGASRPQRSAKVIDPPILTNGTDPTFDHWKLQIQDKLEVNSDHFSSIRARMVYVFSRTGGDAQSHLSPRYSSEASDPFQSDEEMVAHLASIYEDPYKVQNARHSYKSLMMKPSETFTDFRTRFLHLAGQARIPDEDLALDLFDKLTLELQRAVLPMYPDIQTAKELMQRCQALDQGLQRIKARVDRNKTRDQTPRPATTTNSPVTDRKPPTNSQTDLQATRENTPARPPLGLRPSYNNPKKQQLSDQGACFSCGQKGHIARDCLTATVKTADVSLIQDELVED